MGQRPSDTESDRRRPGVGAPGGAEPASGEPTGIHEHPHRHDEAELAHAHPHHHTVEEAAKVERCDDGVPLAHDHGHGHAFERYTYLCSPIHQLDPRVKIVSALLIVLAVVVSPAPRPMELAGLAALLLAVAVIAGVPVGFVLKRSAVVIPFAGMIALFAPLAQSGGSVSAQGVAESYAGGGWTAAYAILAKAWLATLTFVVLSSTTPPPMLFKGLERLKVPDVMLMMLSFMYRYTAVMRGQISSLRHALDSRGFGLSRFARVRLYGSLAGNMFIRSYERGERVYGAMLARGYDGTLPTGDALRMGPADILVLVTVVLAAAALLLY